MPEITSKNVQMPIRGATVSRNERSDPSLQRGNGTVSKHDKTQEKFTTSAAQDGCFAVRPGEGLRLHPSRQGLFGTVRDGGVEWPQADYGRSSQGHPLFLSGTDGKVSKKLCVSRGVRQGSVEGPVVFLPLCNAIMDEVKDTRGSEGLQGVWASDNNDESEEEEEWLDISEVAFVDDMLSFLVYDTEEEVEIWATKVVECFETLEMKANVSKLEIMVVA